MKKTNLIQFHLNREKTIDLGSFYTPDFVVELAYDMLIKFVDIRDCVLLDSSCGYGNFLRLDGSKQKIGVDIDGHAIEIAKENFKNYAFPPIFLHKNSLINVNRQNFGLTKSQRLVIIGNPPYNDKTSIVQNSLKRDSSIKIDSNLKARDIGLSFLLSFDRLQADYMCVLHPLSYLIKKTNFHSLKNFTKNYKLLDSIIISSSIFCPRSLRFFPIIIALYKREMSGLSFDYIYNFSFKTLEGKTFRLSDFDFIAKYIDKYPNKKRIPKADRKAMFYTMRDINALKRSKTFIKKDCNNTVYITNEKYSLYCYVDVFKSFISHVPYYLGNCDIIIDFNAFKKLEKDFIKASESGCIPHSIEEYFVNLLGEHYEN